MHVTAAGAAAGQRYILLRSARTARGPITIHTIPDLIRLVQTDEERRLSALYEISRFILRVECESIAALAALLESSGFLSNLVAMISEAAFDDAVNTDNDEVMMRCVVCFPLMACARASHASAPRRPQSWFTRASAAAGWR